MRRHPAAGFTLIELGLAISVGVLLLGVLFSFYVMVSRTVAAQQDRRRMAGADHALEQLTRDFLGIRRFSDHDAGGFLLVAEDGRRGSRSRLSFCTVRPVERRPVSETTDRRWMELVDVEYALEEAPREPGRLIRIERPLAGPDAMNPPLTNRLVEGIDRFIVEVRVDDEWTRDLHVPADDLDHAWPVAARIRIEPARGAADARPREIQVLLPAGWRIERP